MRCVVLELRPGEGLGPFTLGMPIHEAFAEIEKRKNIFNEVCVNLYDQDPLELDFVISFRNYGFHLRFDPWSQRLRLIEVIDVERLQMQYRSSLFGGESTPATCKVLYHIFGLAFPGIYEEQRDAYTLFYTGLTFAFPIPSKHKEYFRDRGFELPLKFPNGTSPVTSRVSIYHPSSADCKVGVGSSMTKAIVRPLPPGDLYMEEVQVKLREELWFTVGGQHIAFGVSTQDVLSELGSPCGFDQKQEADRMLIHSASDAQSRETLCQDYFYKYFTRGLDILFDGKTHTVKKFVLHTNYPGHDFNIYVKCNFVIHVDGSFHQNGDNAENVITPSTKWEQVKGILGNCGQGVVVPHGSDGNRFGSTTVYGYPNIAFEVMNNGYIASVTLFRS